MERISNNIDKLRNSARFEIENFALKPEEKVIAYFSEFPSIAGFPFKIVLIENQTGVVHSKFRQWDTEYDFNRWDNGIYNLDRLRILSEEKVLSKQDTANLKKWLWEFEGKNIPLSIQNDKALVLDGSEWKFGICFGNYEIDYRWTAATDDIELFIPIIELMKKQHTTKNKRH